MRRFRALQAAWRQLADSSTRRGPAPRRYSTPANPTPGAQAVKPTPQYAAPVTPPPESKLLDKPTLLSLALAAAAGATFYYSFNHPDGGLFPEKADEGQTFTNWSGTHEVHATRVWQPESLSELEQIVRGAHEGGLKTRVVGSALSPNGIAFCKDGMVSMALMDRVLHVDAEKQQVTVQAGARVQEVVEALRLHGLTLQNYASIREQQIGGFTQIGAHGTGAAIPPVDEQVVAMKLVTPALGTLRLSREETPEMFQLARVGLGAMGVCAEVTLQCVPAHRLLEKTFTATAAEVKKHHKQWLKENRHLRYMWIPYTDSVVVVQNNPTAKATAPSAGGWFSGPPPSEAAKLAPMKQLLLSRKPAFPATELEDMGVAQVRDALVAVAPLELEWIKQVNRAEAHYWKHNSGYRVGWSDELLGFDCGGQQWVLEVAFPAGTQAAPSMADIDYMQELLAKVEQNEIPAPAPIEQRWTATSSSSMSPASSPDPNTLHSWVGIIHYLPTEDVMERQAITASFQKYVRMVEHEMLPRYGGAWHWAKLEVSEDPVERSRLQAYLAQRYPVAAFNAMRKELDPKNIMANDVIDGAFGVPS